MAVSRARDSGAKGPWIEPRTLLFFLWSKVGTSASCERIGKKNSTTDIILACTSAKIGPFEKILVGGQNIYIFLISLHQRNEACSHRDKETGIKDARQ